MNVRRKSLGGEHQCPALFIGAMASGQGKTAVTAALARYHAREGRRVRVFKTGPDFLDPKILEAASGSAVHNLDCWMVGVERSRALLSQASRTADLILIEGAMGLYDGEPSGAELAKTFGVPIAAVIDASSMAQTFGAVAHGLQSYRRVPFAGVIANRVASERHAQMLAKSLKRSLPLIAALPRLDNVLPERHLGLVQAEELVDLDAALDRLADAVAQSGLTALPAPVTFDFAEPAAPGRVLSGRTIAIARDIAFSFIYPANLTCLSDMGATLRFFSPLADEPIPDADALYLPGGYPELHAARLAGNTRWQQSLAEYAATGRSIVAECGGLMALVETLVTREGSTYNMAGLLPGSVQMRERLAAIGLQSLCLPQGELRGHTFHYSELETSLSPVARCVPHRHGTGEYCYRKGAITASYLHAYFPSNPAAVAGLFTPEGATT
jgi:cobyrinic acid a,c-diamide synthase